VKERFVDGVAQLSIGQTGEAGLRGDVLCVHNIQ